MKIRMDVIYPLQFIIFQHQQYQHDGSKYSSGGSNTLSRAQSSSSSFEIIWCRNSPLLNPKVHHRD